MIKQVDVYYDGWGEHWLWGSLVSTTIAGGRPSIFFEYSDQARQKGYELSRHKLPLATNQFAGRFPDHQMGLPGPVYDSLPDGWGLLLMDRLFRRRGLDISKITPLDRLTYIGDSAMGALSFKPIASDIDSSQPHIPIEQLAAEIQEIVSGQGSEFLERIIKIGGSPQGARPKALVFRCLTTGTFSTVSHPYWEAWLIKFPAAQENAEVCAVEYVYAECLRTCGIATPDTQHFILNNGLAAFASKRFDRQADIKIPMQSLASFTGADFRSPGSLDYATFLRATEKCTNDVREKKFAFERAVFNVAFNNRDDHPKNFAYLMSAKGQWTLAPAFDVTFCNGPAGYHQMDVMGEPLKINRKQMISLGVDEAELTRENAEVIIDRICTIASRFTDIANQLIPGAITQETLQLVQKKIDENVALLS
jgi:serine/threonine-protein kinase HipA